jgi:hypothetical protein
VIRETPLQSAEEFHDAALRMGEEVDALQHFLIEQMAMSDERLAPCACGHIALFCACPPTNSDRI